MNDLKELKQGVCILSKVVLLLALLLIKMAQYANVLFEYF